MSGLRTAPWRDVVQVMGLPVSVALRGRHAGDELARSAWSQAKADLVAADAMFSRYRRGLLGVAA